MLTHPDFASLVTPLSASGKKGSPFCFFQPSYGKAKEDGPVKLRPGELAMRFA